MEHTIMQGDILVEEQTRTIHFYLVLRTTKKTVTVREIEQINLIDVEKPDGYNYAVFPNSDKWAFASKEITRKVKFYGKKQYIVPRIGGKPATQWYYEPVYHY